MKKIKKLTAFLAALSICTMGTCIKSTNYDFLNIADNVDITSYAEETVDSIILYGMDSSIVGVNGVYYENVLTIPDNYVQSYQITDSDAVSYSITSGKSITITDDGLIQPAYVTLYKYGWFSTTAYIEGAETYDKLTTGDSEILVNTGTSSYYITVSVLDYCDVYVNETIDAYINENITEDMTDLEILTQICRFPATYDYSVYYYTAESMLIYGGGDCWASTSLIIKTCEKLGISAWVRNGNRDSGAGSGHRNAMVELNGVYYELEAGYAGTAPRSYHVTVRTSLFSTRSVSGGLEVYQYDGNEDSSFVLEIPSEIDGQVVVSIGESFVIQNSYITEVIIPDTVVSIGESAFNSCTALETLNIPASVTEISAFAFTNCNALSNFTCDSENSMYAIENGVLYDKDKTIVYFAPYVSQVVLPSTVVTIEDYSFYYNKNLTNITLSDELIKIGVGAFGDCNSLEKVVLVSNDDLTIDEYAFYKCSDLSSILFLSSECEIYSSDNVIPNTTTIYGYKDSTAQAYAEEYNRSFYALGDMNLDGEQSVQDLILMKKYLLGLETINQTSYPAADVNGDGNVNVYDFVLMKKMLLQ